MLKDKMEKINKKKGKKPESTWLTRKTCDLGHEIMIIS
jgi:hypothetical protein